MLKFLCIPEFFGVCPLHLKNGEVKYSRIRDYYILLTISVMTVIVLASVLQGALGDRDGPCNEIIYIISDRTLFLGSVPANILYLWLNQDKLVAIYNKNRQIQKDFAHIASDYTEVKQFLFPLIGIAVFHIPHYMFGFPDCSTIFTLPMQFLYIYLLLIDFVFGVIMYYSAYSLHAVTLKLEGENLHGLKGRILRYSDAFLAALTNLMECQSLFGVYALLLVLNAFLQVTFYADYVVFVLFRWDFALLAAESTLFHFLRILCAVHLSFRSKNYVQEMAKALEEVSYKYDDQDLLSELETFTLQLHQIDAEFDGCGFVKLNFGLINTLIGTTVSYTLVLAQFRVGNSVPDKSPYSQ